MFTDGERGFFHVISKKKNEVISDQKTRFLNEISRAWNCNGRMSKMSGTKMYSGIEDS